MFYYVYILRSKKDCNIYAGYTNNWKRRLEEHNSGQVEATKNRRPFELIYCEVFLNQQDATKREKFFKTGWGRVYLKKILANYYNSLGAVSSAG